MTRAGLDAPGARLAALAIAVLSKFKIGNLEDIPEGKRSVL